MVSQKAQECGTRIGRIGRFSEGGLDGGGFGRRRGVWRVWTKDGVWAYSGEMGDRKWKIRIRSGSYCFVRCGALGRENGCCLVLRG